MFKVRQMGWLVCAVVLSWSLEARAQESAKETPAQHDLNRAGVEAVIAKDYDRAIGLFNSSIALGDLNITRLNLGRAHQRAGHCKDSAKSYNAVFDAPRVAAPSPREIEALARQYLTELERDCPGEIVVVCDPDTIKLYLNTRGPLPCGNEPVEVAGGELVVKGVLGAVEKEVVVQVKGLQRQFIDMTIVGAGGPKDPIVEIPVPAQPTPRGWARNGPIWLAGGAVLLAGGIYLDYDNYTNGLGSNGEIDGRDLVPLPFYFVGSAAVVWAVTQIWSQL
ncbi:MAG: hypothetical protein H0U74_04090 [Bradymonadaceae bacterium]|nr:hypothetical protein [Lujinxingiaceae bacterium]